MNSCTIKELVDYLNNEYYERYARLKSDHNQIVTTFAEITLGEVAVEITVPYWFDNPEHFLGEMWSCTITEEQFRNMFEFITKEEVSAVFNDHLDL